MLRGLERKMTGGSGSSAHGAPEPVDIEARRGGSDPAGPSRNPPLPIEVSLDKKETGRVAISMNMVLGFLLLGVAVLEAYQFATEGHCFQSSRSNVLNLVPCPQRIFVFAGAVVSMLWASLIGPGSKWLFHKRIAAVPGPHMRITEDSFWHVQLQSPIKFADMTSVECLRDACVIACKNPPKLSFSSWENRALRAGKSTRFHFNTHLFESGADPQGEPEWLQALLTLARQHGASCR